VVLDDVGNLQRHLFADDIALCPFPDCSFAPIIPELIVHQCIIDERRDQAFEIEAICRFNIGRYEGRKGNRCGRAEGHVYGSCFN
jgi:hypothetical protein